MNTYILENKFLLIPATEWGGDYRNALHLSVSPSVCNIVYARYNSDIDPDPYLKGQGHATHLKVRIHLVQMLSSLRQWKQI